MRHVHEEEEKPLSWASHESPQTKQESLILPENVISAGKTGRFDQVLPAGSLYFGLSLGLVLFIQKMSLFIFNLVPISDNVGLSLFRYAVLLGILLSLCGYLSGKITHFIAPKRAFSGILLGGIVLYLYLFQKDLQGRFVEMLLQRTMDPLNQAVTVGLALLYLLPAAVALQSVRKKQN